MRSRLAGLNAGLICARSHRATEQGVHDIARTSGVFVTRSTEHAPTEPPTADQIGAAPQSTGDAGASTLDAPSFRASAVTAALPARASMILLPPLPPFP